MQVREDRVEQDARDIRLPLFGRLDIGPVMARPRVVHDHLAGRQPILAEHGAAHGVHIVSHGQPAQPVARVVPVGVFELCRVRFAPAVDARVVHVARADAAGEAAGVGLEKERPAQDFAAGDRVRNLRAVRQEVPVVLYVQPDRLSVLLQVADAVDRMRPAARFVQRRQQHRGQDGDDRDDH